jgi:hypothetical protein
MNKIELIFVRCLSSAGDTGRINVHMKINKK